MRKISRNALLKYCALYPAGTMLLGILTALIPLNIKPDLPLWLIFCLCVPVAVAVAFISFRTALIFCVWFSLGIGSFYLNNYLMQLNSGTGRQPDVLRVKVEAAALDPSLSVTNISWMDPPEYLFMKLNSVKPASSFEADTRQCSGTIYVSNKKLYRFEFGKSYVMTGTLSYAEERYNGSFANYLKSMGLIYLFNPEEIVVDNNEPNHRFLRTMIAMRDNILNVCSSGIEDKGINQFLAGILFGCRQGLDQNTKKQFLSTGTIHIIAISGSHIGILAILFLMFFRPLPVRFRYIIVPIFLLCYIIIIGYLPSAIRAFVMISCFMLLKAALRIQKPMNVLFLTAALMLLVNPYSMMNPGFTFSFIIVTFLILGWNTVSTISEYHNESYYWKPARGLSFSRKMKKHVSGEFLIAVGSTVIAGFASIPLQLYYNNIFTPIMPIVNIILLPLLLPLFSFCILKLFFYPLLSIHFISSFFNFFISGIINFILKTVEVGANTNTSFYLAKPSLAFVLVFYLALACTLIFFKKKFSWILGTVLVLFTAFLICFPLIKNDKAIFLKGAGEGPVSILLLNSRESSAIILNCPSYSAFDIINSLKDNGINKVLAVYAVKLNSYYAGDIKKLYETYQPEQIITFQKSNRTKLVKDFEDFCLKSSVKLVVPDLKEKNTFSENNFCISDGRNAYKVEKTEIAPGQILYSLYRNGKKIGSANFMNSNKKAEQTIELN